MSSISQANPTRPRASRALGLLLGVLLALAACNLERAPTSTPEGGLPGPAPLPDSSPVPTSMQPVGPPVEVPIPTLPPTAPRVDAPVAPDAGIVTVTPAQRPDTILFLGDSITQGWKLQEIYPGAVNAGRTGDTSGQVLGRYRAEYAAQTYDAIVVLVGINDITGGIPDELLRANMRALAEAIRGRGGRIYLASVLPVGGRFYDAAVPGRILAHNAWLRELAANYGYEFVDYYAAMAGEGGEARPGLLNDGVHPSAAGYEVMASVVDSAFN